MRGRRSDVGAAELGDNKCGTRARKYHHASAFAIDFMEA
jgi:hypothetical protein